jgi:hypothetical protein
MDVQDRVRLPPRAEGRLPLCAISGHTTLSVKANASPPMLHAHYGAGVI